MNQPMKAASTPVTAPVISNPPTSAEQPRPASSGIATIHRRPRAMSPAESMITPSDSSMIAHSQR